MQLIRNFAQKHSHPGYCLNSVVSSNVCLVVASYLFLADQLIQEPITQREGALNLCMYVDSTCCRIALVQHSLYGKCYIGAIIYLALL